MPGKTILKDNRINRSFYESLIEQSAISSNLHCPKCKSRQYIRNGKTKNIQRYRCKNCDCSFGESHNTFYFRLRKKQSLEKYLLALIENCSLREAAKRSNISLKTAFLWRHRFLSAISENKKLKSKHPIGVCSLELPYSIKGQRKPSAHLPMKNYSLVGYCETSGLQIISMGAKLRLSKLVTNMSKVTAEVLTGKTENNKLLRRTKSQTQSLTIRSSRLQFQIDKHRILLKAWHSKFRGVATKYLPHYWAWYQLKYLSEKYINPKLLYVEKCCLNRNYKKFYRRLRIVI